MTFERICIVGLGLIGGSLAKAIRRSQPQSFITAVDTNQKSLGDALSEQIIDNATNDLYGGVKGAELVFVCTPVHVVPSLLREIMPILGKDTVITDVGSTKQEIMRPLRENQSLQSKSGYFYRWPSNGWYSAFRLSGIPGPSL